MGVWRRRKSAQPGCRAPRSRHTPALVWWAHRLAMVAAGPRSPLLRGSLSLSLISLSLSLPRRPAHISGVARSGRTYLAVRGAYGGISSPLRRRYSHRRMQNLVEQSGLPPVYPA